MLELRPTCEHCNKPLPPDSTEAMICTFECTFCRSCVTDVLGNVCPNCGGGFSPRPIRPARNLRVTTTRCLPGQHYRQASAGGPAAHVRFRQTSRTFRRKTMNSDPRERAVLPGNALLYF